MVAFGLVILIVGFVGLGLVVGIVFLLKSLLAKDKEKNVVVSSAPSKLNRPDVAGMEKAKIELPKPVTISSKIKTIAAEEPLFKLEPQIIPALPDLKDPTKIDVRYPLIPPYTFARVRWDKGNTELVYEIEEPALNDKEKEILRVLENGIKELINLSFINVQEKNTILEYLEKNIKVLLTELSINITIDSYLKIMYYIYRDFVGLNELEPLMNDYFIEDIECNGLNTPVYIVHRKYRNIRTNLIYGDIHLHAAFVEKLAQKCGKYVSYAEPILDGTLPDGSRCNATYTIDITSRGPTFTVRKFTKTPWSPIALMQKGTASAEVFAYLWMLTEYENSIMVIGGTGSGKTSFLNSLAFFIPPQARIVSIEDTRELMLEHENWLPAVARTSVGLTNILGQRYGEVTLFDLLKGSFRQRPDYVIVGEVRGKEAFVLMQGAASGHPSMATMHAEDVGTLIRRMETPPINLSGSLIESIAAIVVMAFTKVKGKEQRKVISIDEIVEIKEHLKGHTVNTVFRWDPKNNVFVFNPKSKVFEDIAVHYGLAVEQIMKEFKLRVRLLKELYKAGITNYKDVQKIIYEYYKSPEGILKRFKIV